ncbi:MAG: radical SAM protein, partial [Sedimentisphaerales bacterium]|nr:radical SAM protein [Sedimentisphaerales bacterium]
MYPFTLLIKPAGPDCNLACTYCFYARKEALFAGGPHRMSDKVLEALVRDYMRLGFANCDFAWQGGEPTLMGLEFYRRAVELQRRYGVGGQTVGNALQTNAVLLDDRWCAFLHEHQFLVGVSLDGPQHFHDAYRLDHAGRGTYERVCAAIDACRRHDVQFNILVLLNALNVEAPDELFDFFRERDVRYLQFIPCVERLEGSDRPAEFSITPRQYGDFLCRLFDRWLE